MHTANEGPDRIQYKCLVPIYEFTEIKLLFSKQFLMFCLPVPIHSYICDIFIYFKDLSAYSPAGKYVDQSWEYINCSQTHECGNWDSGRTIPGKEINKWDFPCSAPVHPLPP
jgi:hypothetical protein